MKGIPTSNVNIQAAQEIAKQVQQSQGNQTPQTQFQDALNKAVQPQAPANPQGVQVSPATAPQNIQQVNPVEQKDKIDLPMSKQVGPAQKASSPLETGFKGLVGSMANESTGLDNIMHLALSGKQFNQQQLIVLQAATYKITTGLDAASKLAETASGAIKQTMQTQV